MKAQGIPFILLGFALVVFGAAAPFLMVIGILQTSFWLSILSYSSSVIGLLIGVVGASIITQDELIK
jgi:hypothetical protein